MNAPSRNESDAGDGATAMSWAVSAAEPACRAGKSGHNLIHHGSHSNFGIAHTAISGGTVNAWLIAKVSLPTSRPDGQEQIEFRAKGPSKVWEDEIEASLGAPRQPS